MKKLTYLIVISLGLITSCTKEDDSKPQSQNQTNANLFGLTFENLEGTFQKGTSLWEYTIYTKDSCLSWTKDNIAKRYPSKYVISHDTITFYITRNPGWTNLMYFNCRYSNDTLYGSTVPNNKTDIIGIKP